MSDQEFRQYAITNALRRLAPGQEHLSDSLRFLARLDGVSPGAPGFDDHVAAAVREQAGPTAAELTAQEADRRARAAAAAEAEARARRLTGQWTQADVDSAPPQDLARAYHAGQLVALGAAPPHRPERRQPVRPEHIPSAGQAHRWRRMPPWAAQRARADWHRRQRGAGAGEAA